MSEVAKTPGKIASAGQPVLATVNTPTEQVVNSGEAGAGAAAAGEELTEEQKAAAAQAGAGKDTDDLPELSDEQLKAIFAKKGIEGFDGNFETLKEKLKPAAPAGAGAEPTAEEKAAAELAFEKRMLDHFIENGGTPETFVQLKQIASTDLKSLSDAQIRIELKEAGFDEDEIKAVLVERYYQINPEELEQGEDESEEDFDKRKKQIEKKVAYGSKKLESKSTHIKKEAEQALNTLREAINLKDLLGKKETEISSKVDEVVSKIPRKLTFELGMVNDQQISPVEYNVSEDDVAQVAAVLKDPATRKQLLYNEDNSLNLDRISDLLLKEKMFESAIKAVYLEGGDRQVALVETVFPGVKARDIGVGGNSGSAKNGRKGHIVSAGQPTPAVQKS